MKNINTKENRHKTPRIYVVQQQPTSTSDDEQISLYQILDNTNWCRGTLTNHNPKYTQIILSHKYKTKETKVHKYQIPNANCTQIKERAINQIQKLQHTKREQITKPQNQNQNKVATNLSHYSKLQPTNIKEPNEERVFFSLSHTYSLLFLSNFSQQHYAYIGDLNRLIYPNPRKTRLLFHTQKENHSYSKQNSKSSGRQDF